MTIDKKTLKLLKYIYHHPYATHQKLIEKYHVSDQMLADLVGSGYLEMSDVKFHQDSIGNHWKEILPDSKYKTAALGNAEVEKHQWFNFEYVVSHIVIPILLAVISTLITLFLTNETLQLPEMPQIFQTQQEQCIPTENP